MTVPAKTGVPNNAANKVRIINIIFYRGIIVTFRKGQKVNKGKSKVFQGQNKATLVINNEVTKDEDKKVFLDYCLL